MTSVLWFRRDLRRRDHPALLAAREAAGDGDLVCAFVVDPALWDGGGAVRRAWLAANVRALDEALDGTLTLLHGDPRQVVPALAERVGASSVHVSRETTPAGVRRDAAVRDRLGEAGVDWVETGTPYAVGPGLVTNGSGDPYKVFTPFAKAWRRHGWPEPAATPRTLPLRHARNDADATAALEAALTASDLPEMPTPGEEGALRRIVPYRTAEYPGTLVVDTREHALFLVMEGGEALRYGVGVGREGLAWQGRATVGRKAEWPRWTPTRDMIAREPERNAPWAGGMPPGLENPLGARALYLYRGTQDTLYRIHGTNEPWSIGQSVSSGCIRMINQDVIDLYRRVPLGAPVVVQL